MGNFKNLYVFFTTDNRSGWKTKPKSLQDKFPEIYEKIILFSEKYKLNRLPFKQQIWHFIKNKKNIPKCEICEKDLSFKRSITEGYGEYCSKRCTNESPKRQEKIKMTIQKKYGTNYYTETEEFKNKSQKTLIEKYGVDNPMKVKEFHDKLIKKCRKKHGTDYPLQASTVKDKIKNKMIEKYGVPYSFLTKKSIKKSEKTKRDKFINKYSTLNIMTINKNDIKIKCDKCDDEYTINRSVLWNRDFLNVEPCTNCNPVDKQTSYSENEVKTFISQLNIPYKENDRTIIKPKEIDITIPTKKIGIEYNGLIWHSELFVDDKYHITKHEMAKQQDYHLIQIFEDEWTTKKEICKSIIRNTLGLNNKIGARKCTIKEINSKVSAKFFNHNHIQGNGGSSVRIGLYYKETLVAVMTFGKNRRVTGNKHKEGTWELIRYANILNTNIIGGASKLFKYFVNTYEPQHIISYCDKRWFTGTMYEKLGFDKTSETKPNYWYINRNKRMHRFNFRKDVLIKEGFDENKTEKEIMMERKIYRIYDCGNIKYEISTF
jgi:ribosomal protein L34E